MAHADFVGSTDLNLVSATSFVEACAARANGSKPQCEHDPPGEPLHLAREAEARITKAIQQETQKRDYAGPADQA